MSFAHSHWSAWDIQNCDNWGCENGKYEKEKKILKTKKRNYDKQYTLVSPSKKKYYFKVCGD